MKPEADDGARDAIETVLRAEQAAHERVEAARVEAQALREAARDEARAWVNRAEARVAQRQQRHARALAGRIARWRAQAQADVRGLEPPDEAALEAAVAAVAARLTGAVASDDGR